VPPPRLDTRIPETGFKHPDEALDAFLDWVADSGLTLYPHQEEAILAIFAGNHVVLDTPTGSGKSLVAIAQHFKSFCDLGKSWYTAPIKALVSEKFFALCQIFGAEHVGMMTGDGSVNRDAPILCCTAEVLANVALREGEKTGRIPLLRRPRPRHGLADSAPHPAAHPICADVGHPGGHAQYS
jgi:superfamily II RNA helicase